MTSAPSHPALSELIDYWLSELPQPAAEALEEHVFDCAACGDRLDAVRANADAIVGLVRGGGLSSRATTALLNRVSRDRLNVRVYTVAPGEVVACTVGPQDDFLITHFIVDAATEPRLDLAMCDDEGHELSRVQDVAFDRAAGHVTTVFAARPKQHDPSGRRTFKLFAPTADGERELGRYTMDHTAMREA
jgi:hypothetical protein